MHLQDVKEEGQIYDLFLRTKYMFKNVHVEKMRIMQFEMPWQSVLLKQVQMPFYIQVSFNYDSFVYLTLVSKVMLAPLTTPTKNHVYN